MQCWAWSADSACRLSKHVCWPGCRAGQGRARSHPAKHHVLAVQPGGVGDSDEKLRPGGGEGERAAQSSTQLAGGTGQQQSVDRAPAPATNSRQQALPSLPGPTWLPLVFLPALAMDRTPGAWATEKFSSARMRRGGDGHTAQSVQKLAAQKFKAPDAEVYCHFAHRQTCSHRCSSIRCRHHG